VRFALSDGNEDHNVEETLNPAQCNFPIYNQRTKYIAGSSGNTLIISSPKQSSTSLGSRKASPKNDLRNEQFYAAHPTIFIFLDVLSKIQTTTYVKVRTIHMPAVIRRSEMEKLSYLMDQYSKLQANEIDRYQFVKAIGYKYSAKTDI
jgi:hypothetical protein